MHADLKGALEKVLSKRTAYKIFSHKGNPMTKKEVITVLKYGISKGLKSTKELDDSLVDKIINRVKIDNNKRQIKLDL